MSIDLDNLQCPLAMMSLSLGLLRVLQDQVPPLISASLPLQLKKSSRKLVAVRPLNWASQQHLFFFTLLAHQPLSVIPHQYRPLLHPVSWPLLLVAQPPRLC